MQQCSSAPASAARRIPPNSFADIPNSQGDTVFTPTTANQTFKVIVSGNAGTRHFILSRVKQAKGTIALFQIVVPATAGILIDFRNGSLAGAQLLPVKFPGHVYTSTATATEVAFKFVYTGAEWLYLGSAAGGGGGTGWGITAEDGETFTIDGTGVSEDAETFTI